MRFNKNTGDHKMVVFALQSDPPLDDHLTFTSFVEYFNYQKLFCETGRAPGMCFHLVNRKKVDMCSFTYLE